MATKKFIPNPGSTLAIEQGCTCPHYDNHKGYGRPRGDGGVDFLITQGCPLHDESKKA